MRNILSRAGRSVLEEFAGSRLLVGFDFDGTLAPIVSRPGKAVMRPPTRALLRALLGLYPCTVISGRAREDLARRLPARGFFSILGNHGLEPWSGTGSLVVRIRHLRALLDRRLAGIPGVEVEDKTFTLAVHYRRSRAKPAARTAILAAAGELGGFRLVSGKQVINLLPTVRAHKGTALTRERTTARCATALFVGDDETDEDIFALDQPGRLLSIRVGRSRTSRAAFYLPRQKNIDDLLRLLIGFRRGPRAVRSA